MGNHDIQREIENLRLLIQIERENIAMAIAKQTELTILIKMREGLAKLR